MSTVGLQDGLQGALEGRAHLDDVVLLDGGPDLPDGGHQGHQEGVGLLAGTLLYKRPHTVVQGVQARAAGGPLLLA